MRPALALLACLGLLPGCSDGGPDSAGVPADSVTQRQRDSAVGASGLPGARGVTGAMDAADAAAARAAAHDSMTEGH